MTIQIKLFSPAHFPYHVLRLCSAPMLVFDIETKGLDPKKHAVTVVCTEDYFTGETKAYEFERHAGEPDKKKQLIEELVADWNAATSLCAFNGIRFDLLFLQKALDIESDVVVSWALKTTNILEQSRNHYLTTFNLNLLCKANDIPVKISSGLAAPKNCSTMRLITR